jgi:hypothetical protein
MLDQLGFMVKDLPMEVLRHLNINVSSVSSQFISLLRSLLNRNWERGNRGTMTHFGVYEQTCPAVWLL